MDVTKEVFVYSAGIIGAITSLPQLYQIIKTQKVRDINPYFFILFLHDKKNDTLVFFLFICNILIEIYKKMSFFQLFSN